MGKGTITGGGTAGLYQVDIEYNIEYLKKKKEQILKLIEECEKKIDAVELEITPIINKINDIYVEIRDLTAESSTLSAELTPLREQVEPLAQEIKTLKSEISELEGEIAGLEADKAQLEGLEETPEILAQIAAIQSNINYKEFLKDNKKAELDLNEAELSNINSQISEKESQIKANLTALDAKEQELQEQQRFRDSLERKKKILMLYLLSYEKKIADINSVKETENKDIWCVDYSENIEAQTVGLIEIHEENATRYNIRPGYDPDLVVYDSARDGQESPIKAQTAAQAFYNLALFPAWQKWKPFYRYAVITDKRGNVADVDILDYKSPYQNIDINKLKSLTDVDIEYMSCNGAAFEIDDIVVVQFDGNSWDTPKIIGFKEEPKSCVFLNIKIASINLIDFDGFFGWSVRLTQPIEQYVDSKGGYTEDYTVLTNGIALDYKGVALINYSDLLTEFNPDYPVNVWIKNNNKFRYFTRDVKGNYPDVIGNYMLYEIWVTSQYGWDNLDAGTKANADYHADEVWGASSNINVLELPESVFLNAAGDEIKGVEIDFVGIKNISLHSQWEENMPAFVFQQGGVSSNEYSNTYPSFMGLFALKQYPLPPIYKDYSGEMKFEYHDTNDIHTTSCPSGYAGSVTCYRYYWTPQPYNYVVINKESCGSFVETDRLGQNPEFIAGYKTTQGTNGPILSDSIVFCPDGTTQYCIKINPPSAGTAYDYCGNSAEKTASASFTVSVSSNITWTMTDIEL